MPQPLAQVVGWLQHLVQLPTHELRVQLNASEGDVFGLTALQAGRCPADQPAWLPARPSPNAAALFKQGGSALLWYDHLSKAGGTSFCKLAQRNMPRKDVPAYYCMPSEKGMPDARVGQWDNAKLRRYVEERKHRIVSNEWEPFPLGRLQLHPQGQAAEEELSLVLVTSLRDPLNRLVSAYKFWGVLHDPGADHVPMERWLRQMERRAARDAANPQGIGKGPGTGRDFIAQVGRPNFAVWKFSGGAMAVEAPMAVQLPHFATAVRTLAAFDLAIPMEELSAHPQPLQDLLGWTSFKDIHVVPTGKIMNTEAMALMPASEFDRLWAANRFDNVLYGWVRAVFLTRINCRI